MANTNKTIIPELSTDIVELLDMQAERINSPSFISSDPVQFPRRYSLLPDIEIAALLSATIAWGNRTMICRNCDKMLSMMDSSPYEYVMEEAYETLDPDKNIHRTFSTVISNITFVDSERYTTSIRLSRTGRKV